MFVFRVRLCKLSDIFGGLGTSYFRGHSIFVFKQ